MELADLARIAGWVLGVLLGLYAQYLIIKSAVYSGIKRYQDSKSGDVDYETMRDAVTAGMLSYDEHKKKVTKKG